MCKTWTLDCELEVSDTAIRYDTIPYGTAPPPPNKPKKIDHCTMPKHSKFLFSRESYSPGSWA